MPKLTAKLIDEQPKPARREQVILRDSEVQGFGVRFTPSNISYICEARVNGKPKRVTICRYPELTPEEARKQARIVLGKMATGKSPGRPRNGIPTLSEVVDKFFAIRSLRPTSVRHYRSVLDRCLSDWLPMRIDRITKDMVLARHKELTRQGTDGRAQANKALEVLRILLNFAQDNFDTPSGEPDHRRYPRRDAQSQSLLAQDKPASDRNPWSLPAAMVCRGHETEQRNFARPPAVSARQGIAPI